MLKKNFITAILLAAGEGKRFKNTLPKQFHRLSGKKIYLYALETFLKSSQIDAIVIVTKNEWIETIKNETSHFAEKPITLITGGATRQSSSYAALLACNKKTSHIVIHDAVRPFLTNEILKENILLATEHDACDTCTPSYDTIVHSIDQKTITTIPDRSHYLRGQTPQSFSYSLLLKAHQHALKENIFDATDDCQLVLKINHPIKIAKGSDENIKITTEFDLLLAEQILRLKITKLSSNISTSIKGKVFAITGASGGIGQAIVALLEKEGATCLKLSRTSEYNVDLTSCCEAKNIFSTIFSKHGKIDGLINAIGYLTISNLSHLCEEDLHRLIQTNFTAVAYACKYCQIKEGGHILNFSSSSYTRGRPLYLIYSAMKAAMVNFTQGLSLERSELCINSLIPSRANTPMRRKNFPGENPSLLLSCETIAEQVLKTLKTEQLTGMVIEVNKD